MKMAHLEPEQQKSILVSQKIFWVIGAVMIVQLILFAIGFYRNLHPQVRVEYLPITSAHSSAVTPNQLPATPDPLRPLPELPPLPKGFGANQVAPSAPLQEFTFDPPVNAPLEAQLLKEARIARVKSDMRAVALKLSAVQEEFPQSIHAQYQLAEMYESMGIYDKAVESYERVFQYGISQAGPLYHIAAQKLKEGFYKENHFGELMTIGTIHQYQDLSITVGQQMTITIPILASPEIVVDPKQVSVDIRIFDKMGKQVTRNLPASNPSYSWTREVRDWLTNGEEFLVVNYYLPEDSAEGLFGSLDPRSYYGYIIELTYQGELLDQVAWPRILANKISGQAGSELIDFSFEDESWGVDFDNLLPPLSN